MASLAFAQPVLHLTGREAFASVSGHLALLRDPGGALGIDGAVGSTGWRPLPRGLALVYTKDAAWVRFEIDRDPSAASIVLGRDSAGLATAQAGGLVLIASLFCVSIYLSRTPLSIIDAAAQQLRMSPDAPREKTLRLYQKIGIAADRMTSLVDEYLAADRLAGDETTMEVRPSNLRLVIARAVAELPDGRVAVDAGGLPERFPCDPDLLQVALRNLLANADRHSPPDRLVSLAATPTPGGGVELAVRDEGPGIPPDELPHLFRKYFRGRDAQAGTGAGLGLYLVDRIAHRHGGSVTVESAPGAGTTFRIHLPGPSAV